MTKRMMQERGRTGTLLRLTDPRSVEDAHCAIIVNCVFNTSPKYFRLIIVSIAMSDWTGVGPGYVLHARSK